MLIFNRDKKKNLSFSVDLEGIDKTMLEYYIRLSSDTTDYGFKGYEKDGVLEFTIPALGDIIKESEISKLKSIKVEVHDKENRYYLKPFDENIKIEDSPKVVADIKESIDIKKDMKVKIGKVEDIDESVDEKVIEKSKKNTKFGKFLK